MKLESFDQNKKNKKFIIKFLVVGLVITVAIVASSYALYEKRETIEFANTQVGEFVENDVTLAIKIDGERVNDAPTGTNYYVYVDCEEAEGDWDYETWSPKITNITKKTRCSINYNTTASIQTLANAIGSPQTTMDGILENDIDKLVGKEQGLGMVIRDDTLLNALKSSPKYTDEVKQKILNSEVVDENDKYNKGLPCYIFKENMQNREIPGLSLRYCNAPNRNTEYLPCSTYYSPDYKGYRIAASNKETETIALIEDAFNLNEYNSIKVKFDSWADGNIMGTTRVGIVDSFRNPVYLVFEEVNFEKSRENRELVVDISSYNDSYLLRYSLIHDDVASGYTVINLVSYIALY